MALPQGPPVGKAMDALCSPDSRIAWPTKLLVLPLTGRLEIQVRGTGDRPLAQGRLSELCCHNAGSSTMHVLTMQADLFSLHYHTELDSKGTS